MKIIEEKQFQKMKSRLLFCYKLFSPLLNLSAYSIYPISRQIVLKH